MAEQKLQGVVSRIVNYPGEQMTAQDFAELLQWGLSIPGFGTRLAGAVITKTSGSNTAVNISKGWVLYGGRIAKVEAASAIELTNLPTSSNNHGIYIKFNLSTGTAELIHDDPENIVQGDFNNYTGTAGAGYAYVKLASLTTDSNSHIGTITMVKTESRRIYEYSNAPDDQSAISGIDGDIWIKYTP